MTISLGGGIRGIRGIRRTYGRRPVSDREEPRVLSEAVTGAYDGSWPSEIADWTVKGVERV
jgi:hypothetical protein